MSKLVVETFETKASVKLVSLETPRDMRARIKSKAGQDYPALSDCRTTELLTMLRSMRPAGSQTERDFVDQWVAPLGTVPDAFGNHWLTIGDSPIMWSCHTDTVHNKGGAQYVGYADGCAYVTGSNCLGADDTTGVWLMRHMIKAGVPGTYVFHRSEEIGGVGSSWILENTPERLDGLLFAIAFDRMGYSDIITTQGGDTASEDFALSLADALDPLVYYPADGVFTDTQVYSGVIPECSNISVGYHGQHTKGEWQDVDYAMRLLDRMIGADFSLLQSVRDPAVVQETFGRWPTDSYDFDRWDMRAEQGAVTMDDICRKYPDVVSDFLTSCGFSVDELKEYGGID